MAFGGVGAMEIALIMLVLLLLFGARRLPELGRGLGRGIREFKDSVSGITPGLASAERQAPESTVSPRRTGAESTRAGEKSYSGN